MVAGAEEGELVLCAALQGGGQQRQVPAKQRIHDFLLLYYLTQPPASLLWHSLMHMSDTSLS
jgi:hypothetical protein